MTRSESGATGKGTRDFPGPLQRTQPAIGRKIRGKSHPADTAIGALAAVLAVSNLVQGIWTPDVPWLDLTFASLLLSLPITFALIVRGESRGGLGAFLVLCISIAFGYFSPALNPLASDKRISIVITVVYITLFAVLALTNRRRLGAFFITLVGAALVVAIAQAFLADPGMLALGRRTPEGLNVIGAARALGAGVVVTLASAASLQSRKHVRRALLLAIPLVASLILTASRGPVLGVLGAGAVIVWGMPKLMKSGKVIFTAVLGVAGYLAYGQLSASGSRLVDYADSGRGPLYDSALDIGARHPMGIGWGNFYNYIDPSLVSYDQGYNQYPHNVLLEFLAEAGWASATLLILYLLIVARSALLVRHIPGGLALICLAVFSFISASLSSDVIGNRLAWVCLAAILGFQSAQALQPADPPRRL